VRYAIGSIIGWCLFAAGCAGVPPHDVNAEFEKDILRREAAYRLKPQDSIAVTVVGQPGFSQTPVVVSPDGYIDTLLGRFLVKDLTIPELEEKIKKEQKEFPDSPPRIVVGIVTAAPEVIWVGGEVPRPAVVTLRPGMSAMEAVLEVGGNLPSGKMRQILLIRLGPDRTRYIRYVDLKVREQDLTLLPRDIVYVPRTVVATIAVALQQYVYNLTPLQYWTPIMYATGGMGGF
jgi:polysaccharide biosynthesis/export protein PslD